MVEKQSTHASIPSAKQQNLLFGLWMLPVHMTAACWESWMVVSDGFCRTVFRPGACLEREKKNHLTVPTAIRDSREQDLFA